MPVIRPRAPIWTAEKTRESLVDRLARELRGEATDPPRPYIFEVPMGGSKSFHVVVVWEDWSNVRAPDRTEVIMEAYERYDAGGHPGDPVEPRITIAIGATVPEAINDGLLPFRIIGTGKDRDRIRSEMIGEGAIEVRGTADGYILGFPSREIADEVFDRLVRTYPDGHWSKHYYE